MPEQEIKGFNRLQQVVSGLAFIAIFAGWAFGQAAWWSRFHFPYEPQLAFEAAKFHQHLRDDNFTEFMAHVKLSQYYPPLYEISLGATHAVLGFALGNALLFNILLLLIAALAVYRATRRFADEYSALAAMSVFLGFDLLFALTRLPSREIGVTAATATVLAVLPSRRLLLNRAAAIGFAALFSAGLMFKWTFAIYVAIPTIAVFASQFIEKKSKRGYLAGSVLLIALVGFALCAPWYLGVLDLKYLAASSGNDPTGGLLSDRLRFYPQAIGLRYLGGEAAGYILLGLCLMTILKQRRRVVIPATMLTASLALLLLIPHSEPRYAMGVLPALAVLAGGAMSLLPPRWWLRAPIIIFLCLGLAWNFVMVSFHAPIFAQSSGSFRSPPAPPCLAEGQALVERILETTAARAIDTRPASLASHPLNRHYLNFNQDLYPLVIWEKHLGDRVAFLGYDLPFFTSFKEHLSEIDVLVVTDNVWSDSPEHLVSQMDAWADFKNPNWEEKGAPPTDPRLRLPIDELFNLAYTVDSDCHVPIHVYVRRSSGTNNTEQP